MRRTQHGNNNAYCQNNELSWFDWSLVEKHADYSSFCKTSYSYKSAAGFIKDGIYHEFKPASWQKALLPGMA